MHANLYVFSVLTFSFGVEWNKEFYFPKCLVLFFSLVMKIEQTRPTTHVYATLIYMYVRKRRKRLGNAHTNKHMGVVAQRTLHKHRPSSANAL